MEELSVTDMLGRITEVIKQRLLLEKEEESLKLKIKIFLKERNFRQYNDAVNNINVHLEVVKREDIDKDKLKAMLSEKQWSSIIKISSYEKLTIITPEVRNRLKNLAKKQSIMM